MLLWLALFVVLFALHVAPWFVLWRRREAVPFGWLLAALIASVAAPVVGSLFTWYVALRGFDAQLAH